MNISRFTKNNGSTYTCRSCGKLTRETGSCESNASLCLACYDAAGIENEHDDGYHNGAPCAECPKCEKSL